jgi:LysR family nod box-dependent transcriptional activator
MLDDPLLVRKGRVSELTEKGRMLQPLVQAAIAEIDRTLNVRPMFDPLTSDRQFRMSASDYALSVMTAPLLTLLAEQAPNVSVEFSPQSNFGPIDLLRDDVAIAQASREIPGRRQSLFSDQMVCVVRRDHPRLRDGALTQGDLNTLPYVQVALAEGVIMYADDVLAAAGVNPRVSRIVPGFLPVPFAVSDSDRFGFVPERLADTYGDVLGLVVARIPVPLPVLVEAAFWHPSRSDDPALRWLVDILVQVAERVEFGDDDP